MCILYCCISFITWDVFVVSNIVFTFQNPKFSLVLTSRRREFPIWASLRLSPILFILTMGLCLKTAGRREHLFPLDVFVIFYVFFYGAELLALRPTPNSKPLLFWPLSINLSGLGNPALYLIPVAKKKKKPVYFV